MTGSRQQLKETRERTPGLRYHIAEPQRTRTASDTEQNQEWITYCEVQACGKRAVLPGMVQRSKSAAEESAALFALHWLRNECSI